MDFFLLWNRFWFEFDKSSPKNDPQLHSTAFTYLLWILESILDSTEAYWGSRISFNVESHLLKKKKWDKLFITVKIRPYLQRNIGFVHH